jgi:hypothetical protein
VFDRFIYSGSVLMSVQRIVCGIRVQRNLLALGREPRGTHRRWIASEIAGHYHRHVHLGVHAIPAQILDQAVRRREPRLIANRAPSMSRQRTRQWRLLVCSIAV